MKKRNLMKKSFTTKDSKGCEFPCIAFYNEPNYDFDKEKFVRTAIYTGMGLEANSLKELQEKVSKL